MQLLKVLIPMLALSFLMGCGSSKVATPTPQENQPSQTTTQDKPQQTPPTVTELSTPELLWLGIDNDTLSPTELKADEKGDGHFHVVIPFTQPSAIKSMYLRYEEMGKSLKWSWLYNRNLPATGYIMAVFDNKGDALLPQASNGHPVQEGLMEFDLFISELTNENNRDTFKFEGGQTFTLEINYITKDNQEKQFKTSITLDVTTLGNA